MVVYNGLLSMQVFCSDPAVVNDIFTKENRNVDKHNESAVMFRELLGSTLLFSLSDEDWRQKRKALAHAFYKDKLRIMIDVLKTILDKCVTKWNE